MATKKKARAIKVPVTRVALLARINRKLAEQGQQLMAARSARARFDLGDWYIRGEIGIDLHHVDPVDLARGIGVLASWEAAEGF